MSDPKIFPRVDPSDLVGGGMKERFPSWKDDEEVVEATRSELKPEDAEFVAGHIEALHGSEAWKRAGQRTESWLPSCRDTCRRRRVKLVIDIPEAITTRPPMPVRR